MEWKTTREDPLRSYLKPFSSLVGDQRTGRTFVETVKGIITAGSLICQHSAVLGTGKKGWQRVALLAIGVSTQRS